MLHSFCCPEVLVAHIKDVNLHFEKILPSNKGGEVYFVLKKPPLNVSERTAIRAQWNRP